MTDDATKALAEQIYHINEVVRKSAIKAGQEDGVGTEVTLQEIMTGIEMAGLFRTAQMVDNLTDAEADDPELEQKCGAFCDWMNEYVYIPIADQTIDAMLDAGLVEVKGMDADGEFTYGLSKKGYEERDKRDK